MFICVRVCVCVLDHAALDAIHDAAFLIDKSRAPVMQRMAYSKIVSPCLSSGHDSAHDLLKDYLPPRVRQPLDMLLVRVPFTDILLIPVLRLICC